MKKSFTFIEMVVVISIMLLIIPALFSVIFTILREQARVIKLAIVKREGDYLLNSMANIIRNEAISIHSFKPPSEENLICNTVYNFSTTSAALYFKNKEGGWFGYNQDVSNLTSLSAQLVQTSALEPTPSPSPTPIQYVLNSLNTKVRNFTIGCKTNYAYGFPLVNISFDICFKTALGYCDTPKPEENVNLHYETKIKLRNIR